MKFVNKNQYGFSLLILIVCVVAIGIIGSLGYVIYNRFIENNDTAIIEQSSVAEDMGTVTASVPNKIVDVSDIDKAITALDQISDSETNKDVNLITEQVAEF